LQKTKTTQTIWSVGSGANTLPAWQTIDLLSLPKSNGVSAMAFEGTGGNIKKSPQDVTWVLGSNVLSY
jgi:hypothetical protein